MIMNLSQAIANAGARSSVICISTILTITAFGAGGAMAQRAVDADVVIDNDAKAALFPGPAENDDEGVHEKNLSPRAEHSARGDLYSFSTVMAHMSPYLEESFDVFLLVNTAQGGSDNVLVPSQHMLVLERSGAADVFSRDAGGTINGAARTALQIGLFPVSSGQAAQGSILTFSGIYRVDAVDSRGGLATGIDAPMSYALYIDHTYSGGRDSGVAVHGTPRANYGFLGNQRKSHGCVRTRHDIAKMLYTKLMPESGSPFSSSAYWESDLASFDILHQLPDEAEQGPGGPRRGGLKALIVLFNGY